MIDAAPRSLGAFASDTAPGTRLRLALWFVLSSAVFERWWLPRRCRPTLLRLFGCKIGPGAVIRPAVRIHAPWNLRLGAHCWLGEGVMIVNHVLVELEDDVCVSQRAIVCSSSHDAKDRAFRYRHSPVLLATGTWVGIGATVLPGVVTVPGEVVGGGTQRNRRGNVPG